MRHGNLLTVAAVLIIAGCTAQKTAAPDASLAAGPGALVNPMHQAAVAPWTAYRTFYFDPSMVDVSASDMSKIYEIVAYLKDNPSFDVGIDGTLQTEGVSEADRSLGGRRASSVRHALMDAGAGVASYKIFTGAFAEPHLRRAGQIQVLVGPRTGSLKTAL